MPGQTIGTSLIKGYPGTTAREGQTLKRNRQVRATDTTNINFGDPVVLNADGTVSRFYALATTLGAALTSSTQYTSVTVPALAAPVDAGDQLVITESTNTQTVTISAAAATGATTVDVNPFTANFSYTTAATILISSSPAQFAGVAVREVKQATEYPATGYPYLPGQPCDVQELGGVTVTCAEGTPTAGGKVYIATSIGTNVAVGDFCATATPAGGATTVMLTNAEWDDISVDANDVAEMTLLVRNRP